MPGAPIGRGGPWTHPSSGPRLRQLHCPNQRRLSQLRPPHHDHLPSHRGRERQDPFILCPFLPIGYWTSLRPRSRASNFGLPCCLNPGARHIPAGPRRDDANPGLNSDETGVSCQLAEGKIQHADGTQLERRGRPEGAQALVRRGAVAGELSHSRTSRRDG